MKITTTDNINHGDARLEPCLEAQIYRFTDGYILCPILWSGGQCEECMEVWETRQEKYGE